MSCIKFKIFSLLLAFTLAAPLHENNRVPVNQNSPRFEAMTNDNNREWHSPILENNQERVYIGGSPTSVADLEMYSEDSLPNQDEDVNRILDFGR